MICLDSWVWLEYLLSGEHWETAASAIEEADTPETGGIVPATVIAEVAYRLHRVADEETAGEAIDAMRSFEHIDILPITDRIAEYGAELRDRYDDRGVCELSYADAIHLAMAAAVSECRVLYSGDPDFATVDEVETIVL